ncbi:hypothetical protein FISHEDRAFT_73920 [Fistulina hepatica ATCC 64428]|uniref:Uncharacterized protein n=1 Tax=Fistulina hepatica ATCC 64428 TaxID=1128425 RepID=A0A0D7AE55_9AGAR|nr:hypothetical protein FISHEDRAFT_73920 [Fistulina hepatica ATCC 64428]
MDLYTSSFQARHLSIASQPDPSCVRALERARCGEEPVYTAETERMSATHARLDPLKHEYLERHFPNLYREVLTLLSFAFVGLPAVWQMYRRHLILTRICKHLSIDPSNPQSVVRDTMMRNAPHETSGVEVVDISIMPAEIMLWMGRAWGTYANVRTQLMALRDVYLDLVECREMAMQTEESVAALKTLNPYNGLLTKVADLWDGTQDQLRQRPSSLSWSFRQAQDFLARF